MITKSCIRNRRRRRPRFEINSYRSTTSKIYQSSTLFRAQGVLRRKVKLDLSVGSYRKHRTGIRLPISFHPCFSTRYSTIVLRVIPCRGSRGCDRSVVISEFRSLSPSGNQTPSRTRQNDQPKESVSWPILCPAHGSATRREVFPANRQSPAASANSRSSQTPGTAPDLPSSHSQWSQ